MRKTSVLLIILAVLTLAMAGCTTLSPEDGTMDTGAQSQARQDDGPTYEPYHPSGFDDILIPGELTWNREASMVINTDSFAGGVLNFTGRVEVNSLTDFFVNTMKKNGWTMKGSIRSENVLLAFTRANGTCLIKIRAGGIAKATSVDVYVSSSR